MKIIATGEAVQAQLARLDWRAPWWQPWRAVGQRVAQQVLAGGRVVDALNAQRQHMQAPCTVEFVPQSALPDGMAYEAFIFQSGQVPTRENLHDLFNGLAWLVFPQTKRRLNLLQYGELAASGVQSTRGALRDALTLFDENAALWVVAGDTPNQVIQALHARQWQRAFVELRSQWQPQWPVLFGHALLEKLVSPYKSITAHVYLSQAATETIAGSDLDSVIAQHISTASLVPKPFVPLPVLGVPGWWAANEQPVFYADSNVFRAPRLWVKPAIPAKSLCNPGVGLDLCQAAPTIAPSAPRLGAV
jgi:Protein of unknown function (DUF3025)